MTTEEAEVEFLLGLIENKYAEWLEMAGENSPALLLRIITRMYIKERDQREHVEKLLWKKRCVNE